MTKEAIGKGRAAIFSGLGQTPATSNLLPETSSKSPDTSDKAPATSEVDGQQPAASDQAPDTSNKPQINSGILSQALAEAQKAPKITIFSPKVAAVLRYKQLTTIRYSFSTEARERLEQTVKDTYPELYEAVEKALSEKR